MRIQLRSKIIYLVLFSVIIAVGGTVFFTTKIFLEDKRNYITDVNSVASAHAARILDQVLVNVRFELLHLNDLLKNPNKPEKAFTDKLAQVAHLEQLNIYDAKNNLILSAGRSKSPADSAWIHAAIESYHKSGNALFHFPSDKTQSLLYIVPIENRLYATLFSGEAFLPAFNMAKALNVSLVNQYGDLLISNRETQLLNDPAVTSFALDFFTKHKNQQVWAQLLPLKNGERYLVALSPLEKVSGSGVMVFVPDAESTHLAAQITRNSLPFIFGILIFVSLLGFLFSLRLTRSLENLTKATAQISSGNWNIDITTRSRDEVGQLVKAFKKMARELKTREEDLKIAHENLLRSEKLASLGKFSAGIAHEIKNPLTSILTYSQLIERKLAKEELTPQSPGQFAKYIVEETLRANRIIMDLLTFARQKPPVRTSQNLIDIVETALNTLRAQIENHQVRLLKGYSTNDPIVAPVDSDQIHQVISNLVLNAIQAMENNNPSERELQVQVKQEAADAIIAIRDNGPGISPENLRRVFEPFFSTKATGKGTGLGLAMCHGIIQQHAGHIRVSSQTGEGALFEIKLPLA